VTDTHDASAEMPAQTRFDARGLLWVLAVLGGFLALGALWFALFGSPQVVGPEAGATGTGAGSATTSPASVSATQTASTGLTAADVDAVLGELDYVESNDSSVTEYQVAVARMLRGVDLKDFAESNLQAAPAITWTDVGAQSSRIVTGAEKDRIVAESVAYWVSKTGPGGDESVPLDATFGVRMAPPIAIDRTLQDSYYEVMAQGIEPIGLMFGATDADNPWTWSVVSAAVTGPDTADVAYTALAKPDVGWRFLDPSMHYVKHLRFSRVAGGAWKLSGWSNHSAFESQFEANVSDPGRVHLDEWWGSL